MAISPKILLDQASCLECYSANGYSLQMLRLAMWARTVAGQSQIVEYSGPSPSIDGVAPADPTLPAMAYSADGTGSTYVWDTATQTWDDGGPIDPAVLNWFERVVANGGAGISAATIYSVNTFYKAVVSAALLSKILALNVFAPDSIAAAMTPLIVGAGNALWDASTYGTPPSCSAAGFGGNSTGYVKTGIFSVTHFDTSNCGICAYVASQSTNNPLADFGSRAGTNGGYGLLLCSRQNANNTVCISGRNGTNLVSLANQGAGFYSCQRASSTSNILCRGSSGGFSTIGSESNAIAASAAIQLYCFHNDTSATNSDALLSFGCVNSLALTTAEAQTLFGLVQTLRTNFGGGYL